MSNAASSNVGTANTAKDWDQIMLAMDVVDTLRHREAHLDKLVNEATDDKALLERVRRIYKAQGIDVPDRVIRDAVDALKEERFAYEPGASGFRRKLATWYVHRHRWGKKVVGGAAAAAVIGSGVVGYNGYQGLKESGLQSHFQEVAAQAAAVARTEPAKAAVAGATESARSAIAIGGDSATLAVDQLERLSERIADSYTLRIVSEPGKKSAVYRHPSGQRDVRNYYLIVDALNANGKPVNVLITSEEDNATKQTSRFGVRVSEAAFEQVKADKLDDGIIQNNVVGSKQSGALTPEYRLDSNGSAIFKW